MKRILIIGIGAGNPDYITMQAVKALNRTDVFFLMDKGQSKDKLIDLRREICETYITEPGYRFVEADCPERARVILTTPPPCATSTATSSRPSNA